MDNVEVVSGEVLCDPLLLDGYLVMFTEKQQQ